MNFLPAAGRFGSPKLQRSHSLKRSTRPFTLVLFQDKNEQGTYTAPLALINGEDHYLHRDHLGSILAISNASGSLVEERDFSPWEELRSLRMAGGAAISGVHSATLAFSNSLLDRGFTGHEHFPQVNLIHMNGRLYDPRKTLFSPRQ